MSDMVDKAALEQDSLRLLRPSGSDIIPLIFSVFCIVCTVFLYCFVYEYSCLFYLCYCKDYCHRVTTQMQ